MARKPKTAQAPAPAFIAGIKGMDANMMCRDFKFEASGEYRHDGAVKACAGGVGGKLVAR